MLFCEPLSSFHSEDMPSDGVRLNKSDGTSRVALLRQLDELRNALAKTSADYRESIRASAALREALVRADLRNRRSEAETKRQIYTAASARAGLELAMQREAAAGAALTRCEASLQRSARIVEEQAARMEDLQRKNAEASDHCATQRALLFEYQGRATLQDKRLQLLQTTSKQGAAKPAAKVWFWRFGPARQPSCSAQHL